MKLLHFIDNIFSKSERFLLIFFLSTMIILQFSLVVMRNFFNYGIVEIDILVRQLALWVGILGAAQATKLQQHINVDVLTRMFSDKHQVYLKVIVNGFSLFITSILAYSAWVYLLSEREFELELMFGLNTWVFQSIIPIGFVLISYRFFMYFIESLLQILNGDN